MSNDPKKTVLGWIPQSPGQPWNGQPVARPAQPPYPQQQPVYPQPYAQQPQPPFAPQQPHVIQSPYAQQPQMPAPQRAARPSPPPYAPQPPAARPSPPPYAQPPFAQPPAYAPQGQHPATRPSPQPYAQQPYAQQPQQPAYPYQQPQPFAPSQQPYGAQPQQPSYGAQPQPFAPSQPAAGHEAVAAQNHAASYLKARSAEGSRSKPRPITGADATVGVSQRVRFIRQTYLHLLGAILVFAGLLYLLMTNDFLVAKVSIPLVKFAVGGRWNWGVVLAAFMAVSYVADHWATHATSRGMQYAGLGFYVLAEALIFVPLLAIVEWKTQQILARGGAEPHIIRDSAFVTIGVFTALTASVFVSKKDFSFLRSALVMASGAALTLIFMALTFGFNLGLVFSGGMVLLAAGYILFQTSQVLAHYNPNQHVAAALGLFSSVALMFWYVIRIFMKMRE